MKAPIVPTALPNVPIYASASEGFIPNNSHDVSIFVLLLDFWAIAKP
ncbi:MAG: hypothetical protein Ct9H90mP18_06050 [Gammaproteobacteria bacterium]|nr:MAG: hypothetical protein Ct9H90mP18_06050 [Gammaproteobacteria bacterium]